MTGTRRGFRNRAGASKKASQWYRIENHVIDENNSTADKAVIYIYDQIGESWFEEGTGAAQFTKDLSALKVSQIDLHLNSPGGDVFEGVAIYNALKSHPAEVTVIVDALAASAASFIAQAGDKVIMSKGSTMMIHDGAGFTMGNAADHRQTADLLDKLSDNIADIYATNAGQSVKFWRNLMIEETWYNAAEAVEVGLTDEIGGEEQEDALTIAAKWENLPIFNYAGRDHAPSPIEVRTRIANQLDKEKRVKPQNSEQGAETGSPDNDPNAQTTSEPNPAPGGEPIEGTPPGGQSDSEPDPVTPEASPVQTTPNNKFTFNLGGQQVNMTMAEVAAQMSELYTFRNESIVAGKKAFVKQLHDEGKITGPQVEAIESFALSLGDDQFDAWKATFAGASSVPMLANHAGGTTNHQGTGDPVANAQADQIEVYKGVVENFKRSNMATDQIMQTPSYKNLVALQPDYKL